MDLNIEIEQEDDGRWIAEVPDLPGVMVYGSTRNDAVVHAKALALRVLAERIEHGEDTSSFSHLIFREAA
jgi:predicted RNase H-like HicB family nuclease